MYWLFFEALKHSPANAWVIMTDIPEPYDREKASVIVYVNEYGSPEVIKGDK